MNINNILDSILESPIYIYRCMNFLSYLSLWKTGKIKKKNIVLPFFSSTPISNSRDYYLVRQLILTSLISIFSQSKFRITEIEVWSFLLFSFYNFYNYHVPMSVWNYTYHSETKKSEITHPSQVMPRCRVGPIIPTCLNLVEPRVLIFSVKKKILNQLWN
jgi:hypothetical protein